MYVRLKKIRVTRGDMAGMLPTIEFPLSLHPKLLIFYFISSQDLVYTGTRTAFQRLMISSNVFEWISNIYDLSQKAHGMA